MSRDDGWSVRQNNARCSHCLWLQQMHEAKKREGRGGASLMPDPIANDRCD
jgi:hypothetical protein